MPELDKGFTMALEEEYKKSTRWLGPLFALALVGLVLTLLCAPSRPADQRAVDPAPAGETGQ